jgi:uncharacterized protein YqeY
MGTVKEKLNEDLKSFMKNKETVKLNTVRMVKKNITELETSAGHNGEASDEEILKIIQKMVKQGTDTARIYKEQGRDDLYNEETEQLEVLKEYLPKQLSEEEISAEIDKVMSETGLNQMGPLMKELNKRLSGRADGKTISNILKTKLK